MEEKELFREMAKLDRELLAMIEDDPELGEIYSEELGEAPGSVVYLPQSPHAGGLGPCPGAGRPKIVVLRFSCLSGQRIPYKC